MLDFIKKHPCWAATAVGFSAILLSFVSEQFAAYGLAAVFFFIIVFRFAGIILIGINIAAMLLVANDKSAAGIILTLPFGGLGAVIGLLFNPSYKYEIAVKIIFSIQLWTVIWAFVSLILFEINYYSLSLIGF